MFTPDWWNSVLATATDGPITEDFLGTASVTESKIRALAVSAAKIGAGAVTTAKITDANVLSTKLSADAVLRTVIISFPKLTTTEAGGAMSSGYIAYLPIKAMDIQSIQIVTNGAWEQATCDHFTLFRNSSACVANVGFKSIASTAPTAGTLSCVGAVSTCGLVAANTLLTIKSFVSTCSVSAPFNLIVHYNSVG